MSQLESFSKKSQLQGLKHPWQPDWVKTKADVEVLFKYLDHFRYLVEEEMDWYPPFIVFVEKFNGKETFGYMKTSWCETYDPYKAGKVNPMDLIEVEVG